MPFCFALALICFWVNLIVQFTSQFSLSCADLCKVSIEDGDHVISDHVLNADIEGNYFFIILSRLLVWRRSDWFSVSLWITGYVSLHNQFAYPQHTTFSKLVFTSHCICFYYIIICPVSSAYIIGDVSFAWPRYIGCWLLTGHCSGYLFPGCLFPALFANQILIYFMSTCVIGFVSFAFTVCWLTLNRSLFRFYCIWDCLLTRHWFVQCQQQHLYIGVIW